MLDCLGNKAVVSTMLPILGGSVTVPKQTDLDLESTPVCSLQSQKYVIVSTFMNSLIQKHK